MPVLLVASMIRLEMSCVRSVPFLFAQELHVTRAKLRLL